MTIGKVIHNLRVGSNLSQEQFATIFDVSQQSVQKWENGTSVPALDKIVNISNYFGVSLDTLILGNGQRAVEETKKNTLVKPQYVNMHDWEFYSSNLLTEYQQSIEEGLDIEKYKDVFVAVSKMPKDEFKKRMGDVIFEIINTAPQKQNYPYFEPSSIEAIQSLRHPHTYTKKGTVSLEDKIYGAWMGRICGCLLGKPLETLRTDILIPFLTEVGNYPVHRYVKRTDLSDYIMKKYGLGYAGRCYYDEIYGEAAPVDDDTNYTVLYQEVIEKYGKNFTPFDISRSWLDLQVKNAYCTAERVAFCNFVKGYAPPESAIYKNPYREWIGAQIRCDYFGYINPGNPEMAAEMAFRDACISHTKNGIYGEMFVAAMLAVAAETNNIEDIILGGLAEIPHTSRLHKEIMSVLDGFKNGVSQQQCFDIIHSKYDEHTDHGWCHTIPNAMIVVASLLYGKSDYAKSICMSVERGFDTDCNGATVGSILGMANGINTIPAYWTAPVNDTLVTSILGVGTVKISDRAKLTLKHINQK